MFATPLGLLALVAIPTIVAIHLFRRRFPVRPIAGLFLWQMARDTPEGGGKITKLPVTTSLILECLAALALALILAGARVRSDTAARHLVVLLDDSVSMTAVDGRGESARDRAVQRVLSESIDLAPEAGSRSSGAATVPPCSRARRSWPRKLARPSRRGRHRRRTTRSRSACGWPGSSQVRPVR